MPCLNEEPTVGICVKKALSSMRKMGIPGEVIVSDNGSSDNSVRVATSSGARVVHQSIKGYGAALMKGFSEVRGKYIIMGDADDSYDFSNIETFVKKLDEGYDLVMGTRFGRGEIKKDAMSFLHKLGNPVMTLIVNILFRAGISDVNCGLRAFSRAAMEKLELKCSGMEFASEIVVKAVKEKFRITEVPIILHPDGRNRRPHLKTFKDGWRHLRFLLIYSPKFLYLVPGALSFLVGAFILIRGLFFPFKIKDFTLDFHFNFFGSILAIIGIQICLFGLLGRSFAYLKGFDKHDKFIGVYLQRFSLERNIIWSFLVIILGFLAYLSILLKWIWTDFGPLFEVRKGIVGLTLLAIGFQYFFYSFIISMLLMESKRDIS